MTLLPQLLAPLPSPLSLLWVFPVPKMPLPQDGILTVATGSSTTTVPIHMA